MKKQMKQSRGITLIALVITIIILIILAGITIAVLTGEDGLITKAKQGAQNYQNAAIEEQTKLNTLYGDFVTETIGVGNNDASASLILFKRQIAQAITNAGVTTNENDTLEVMVENIGKIRDDVTIILCANNETSDIQYTRAFKDQPVRLMKNSFTKTGANINYIFTGWNTEQDGTGIPYEDEAIITPTESAITLYAQWDFDITTNTVVTINSTKYKVIQIADNDIVTLVCQEPKVSKSLTGTADWNNVETLLDTACSETFPEEIKNKINTVRSAKKQDYDEGKLPLDSERTYWTSTKYDTGIYYNPQPHYYRYHYVYIVNDEGTLTTTYLHSQSSYPTNLDHTQTAKLCPVITITMDNLKDIIEE